MIVNGEKASWEAGSDSGEAAGNKKLPDRPGCCRKERRDRSKEKIIPQKRSWKRIGSRSSVL